MEQSKVPEDLKKLQAKALRENLTSGNALRGQFLYYCSKIEVWMSKLLHDLKISKKGETFVGQKFSRISNVVKQNPNVFSDAQQLENLLKELESYSQIRTIMAHASLEISSKNDGSVVYLFTMPAYNKFGKELQSTAIEHDNFTAIVFGLASLSNQIRQQKLKATPAD